MSENPIPDHIPQELVRPLDVETDPDLAKNPFKTVAKVQSEGRDIFYNPRAFQGAGGWIVTKAEYLREILQSPEIFSSRHNTGFAQLLGEEFDLLPLEVDPPEHMKYRIHFNQPLSPKSIAPREAAVRDKAVTLIEAVREKGECDFVEAFGTPFPVDIFMLLMGMPEGDRDKVLDYEYRLLHFSNTPEDRAQAARDIYNYLTELYAEKLENPADDLATMVTGIEVDGRPATEKEILGMLYMLFVGGLDTVASSLGFVFRYLANNPEDRARLRKDKSLIPDAIEEFLRMHSVVEPRRSVTRDVNFHGVQFKKGDFVNCVTAMGSLDPEEFDDPLVMNFGRRPNRHFAFALGPHRCMGSNLARLEMRVALEEWLDRIPEFSIKEGEDEKITAHQGAVLSLSNLPLVW